MRRRSVVWALRFIGAVLLVLMPVAAGRWLWLPNWRPALREGERYGIDVSAHQGRIAWERVAEDGIHFAYIKATEGGDFVDTMFARNWAESQKSGLDRGAYHFFTLCTPGAAQARNLLAVAPPESSALAPAVDLELAGNCKERPPAAAVHSELAAFLESVEAAWERPVVLYLGNDFERLYGVRRVLDRPLWLRRFLVRPDTPAWTIWQIHGYAQVGGVSGEADLNVMRTTLGTALRPNAGAFQDRRGLEWLPHTGSMAAARTPTSHSALRVGRRSATW